MGSLHIWIFYKNLFFFKLSEIWKVKNLQKKIPTLNLFRKHNFQYLLCFYHWYLLRNRNKYLRCLFISIEVVSESLNHNEIFSRQTEFILSWFFMTYSSPLEIRGGLGVGENCLFMKLYPILKQERKLSQYSIIPGVCLSLFLFKYYIKPEHFHYDTLRPGIPINICNGTGNITSRV